MKKIELVIEPAALDRLTKSADGLNLSELHVTEVHRTPGRFYHGRESLLDLVDRLKIDFTVADDAAMRIAHELIENVQLESLAILWSDNAGPSKMRGPLGSNPLTLSSDVAIGRCATIQ